MKYNLTDIYDNAGKTVTEEIELELDAILMYGEEYELKNPSMVKFTATNISDGKAEVSCEFSCEVELPCDRCLKPVVTKIEVTAETVAFSPEVLGEEDEQSEFVEGYKVDVDELVLSEMLLNWPSKILCKEDCKGICSVCGHDLNEGECGCDRFVPNPAFAGLSEMFNLPPG